MREIHPQALDRGVPALRRLWTLLRVPQIEAGGDNIFTPDLFEAPFGRADASVCVAPGSPECERVISAWVTSSPARASCPGWGH